MRGSARRADLRPATVAGHGARGWDISPEDRIGPPLKSARARLARRLTVLVMLAAAGWAWTQGVVPAPEAALAKLASLVSGYSGRTESRSLPSQVPSQGEPAAKEGELSGSRLDAASASQREDDRLMVRAPAQAMAAAQPIELNAPAASAPAPQKSDEELSQPRAPVDPVQKRAAAAGLSPDLSPALLSRLTAADFDNAATAIRTAVAETPDDGSLVWPRQRKPDQALFRVHFVPGAASAECRRYVVTVVMKDGWSTTAPPMERCGSPGRSRTTGVPR